MKNKKLTTLFLVFIILLIAGPSVIKAFADDYPWGIRFAVTLCFLGGIIVAVWPVIRGTKEPPETHEQTSEMP